MKFLKNIFWNSSQSRTRTGYRLLVAIFLYSIISASLIGLLKNLSEQTLSSDAPLWFFLAYAAIQILSGFLSIWLVGRFLDRRAFIDFGFHLNKNWWLDFGFGFVLGAISMSAIFLVELSAGWLSIQETFHTIDPELPFIIPISVVFILFIAVSFSEELLTRGYILKNLSEGLNFKALGPKGAIIIAWIISSVLFGLFHLNNPNATYVSTINIMLAGILLGYGYVLTGELAIPIGIHLSWNFFQGNVFGFPVSGLKIPSRVVTFFSIEQTGPEIWTGSSFGPEAGLIGLCAMLLGMLLIGGWVRWRRKSAVKGINLQLAGYTPEKKTA